MSKNNFYAVKVGKVPGVYTTWAECEAQIKGFRGADHHAFKTNEEAMRYMDKYIKTFAAKDNILYYVDEMLNENYYLLYKIYLDGDIDDVSKAVHKRDIDQYEIYAEDNGNTAVPEALAESYYGNVPIISFGVAVKPNPAKPFIIPNYYSRFAAAEIQIYVDGSFNNTTRVYGGGFIVLKEGQEIHRDTVKGNDPEAAREQNSTGELLACMAAVLWCKKNSIKEIEICHDYMGVSNFITGQWEAKKPCSIKYKEWMAANSKGIKITFTHVKGHSGDEWNEAVDKLARQAVN
jgi:viroplasmin and RNaseH domain-containing protein